MCFWKGILESHPSVYRLSIFLLEEQGSLSYLVGPSVVPHHHTQCEKVKTWVPAAAVAAEDLDVQDVAMAALSLILELKACWLTSILTAPTDLTNGECSILENLSLTATRRPYDSCFESLLGGGVASGFRRDQGAKKNPRHSLIHQGGLEQLCALSPFPFFWHFCGFWAPSTVLAGLERTSGP